METEKAIEVLKKFLNEKEDIYKFLELNPAVETILREFRKQEKMIDLMIKHFYDIINNDDNASLFPYEVYLGYDNIEERIEQYFEKKAEEVE